jgi:hypothetical protein
MLKRFRKNAVFASACEAHEAPDRSEQGAAERDRRLLVDALRARKRRERTEARDEVDAGNGEAVTAHEDRVPGLVNGDQQHEDDRELPTEVERVEPDRGEKREARQREFWNEDKPFEAQERKQQPFELREQHGEPNCAAAGGLPIAA